MRGPVCILLLVVTMSVGEAEEIYPGYTWQALGNGIYLHSQADPLAGPVDGNSTVVIDDDGVLVVDTHINPAVARAVIDKIRSLTDSPVTYVVNTHWHDDHVNGNHEFRKAFPDVRIVSHRATLKSLRDEWQAMEDQRRAAYAAVDVAQLRDRASAVEAEDPGSAIAYRVYAGYVEALRPELPTLVLEYPDTVFGDVMSLEFGDRPIEIRWLGRGNTDGDVVVWLPADGVLVTGDLLVAPIPFAFDAPMSDWRVTLGRLAGLDARILIPGHGPAQHDGRHLASVMELLDAFLGQVRAAHESGIDFEGLEAALDFDGLRDRFAGGDPERLWAWDAYFVRPGLNSAWTSLGYPEPDE